MEQAVQQRDRWSRTRLDRRRRSLGMGDVAAPRSGASDALEAGRRHVPMHRRSHPSSRLARLMMRELGGQVVGGGFPVRESSSTARAFAIPHGFL